MNEFDFVTKLAEEREKEAYLVDRSFYETFQELSKLPIKVKYQHLKSLWKVSKFPSEVDQIMCTQREQYMLDQIVGHEGPLDTLERKGFLLVGMSHAFNYHNQIHQQT